MAVLLLAQSCGSDPESEPEQQKPDPPPELVDVQASATSPRNVKVVWAPVADASVRIERLQGDDYVEVATRPSDRGRFLDLGLLPEVAYQYRVVSCKDEACAEPIELPAVTTPATEFPELTITVPPNGAADDVVIFGAFTFDNMTEGHAAAVDRDGRVLWEYIGSESGFVTEIQPLADGTLATGQQWQFVQLDLDGSEVFRYTGNTAHHDIDELADGRLMFLTFDSFETSPDYIVSGDGIEILGLDGVTVEWSWLARDHIPLTDVNAEDIQQNNFGLGWDWTHSNALGFDEGEQLVYLNVRNLNRIYAIDYPSGDVAWIMGDGGDFGAGLWSHSHDPQYLSPGRVLIFDNGFRRPGPDEYSRVIEVQYDPALSTAEIVWEYRETPDFFTAAMGGCQLLDNGNILVTDSQNGRIFEVTRDKEKVWELRHDQWSYKAVAVPRSFFTDW